MGKILRRVVKVGLGTTVAAGAFGGIVYYRRLKENKSIDAKTYNAQQLKYDITVALDSIQRKDPVPILLYRYTSCPFCGKVKAFLDYYKIKHECVEVEPMFKGEVAQSKYKKVPQLQFITSGHTGPWLVDSDEIINTLAPLVGAGAQLTDPEVNKWREWANAHLVRHLVVNINTSLMEAWRGYQYVDHFDTIPYRNKLFLKLMGAPVMYMVSTFMTKPKLKALGDIKDGDDLEKVLYEQCSKWTKEGLAPKPGTKGTPLPFHGGKSPDLADINVYGVLQSIRGHRVYSGILKNTDMGPWIAKMDEATGKKPGEDYYATNAAAAK